MKYNYDRAQGIFWITVITWAFVIYYGVKKSDK
jgi:hypothetical protein